MVRPSRQVLAVGFFCTTLSAAAERGLRPLTTDRPDPTESPVTVDAGHVQSESSLVEYARASEGGDRVRTRSVLPTNIKYGWFDNADIQLVFTPQTQTRIRYGNSRDRVQGFGGDAQIRLKVNLWGNDGSDPAFGNTALGVMPFIKFPTGPKRLRGRHVEGGIIVPMSFTLLGEFSLGVMAELDVVYDPDQRRYGVDVVHSATLGHALAGPLSGYVEYVGTAPRVGRYQPVASQGLTCALNGDSSIDAGARRRLSRSAHEVTAFAGFSRRF